MALKLNGTNSVAAPAYAGDDADTGLQCGTNELKLVTGGTARATVDSDGDLGIGTASPSALLHIAKSGGNAKLLIQRSNTAANTNDYGSILWQSSAGNNNALIGVARQSAENDGYMFFSTASSGTLSERMRLDSSGRFLFNTTSNQGGHLFQIKDGDASLTKLTSAAGGNDVNMLRFRVHNSGNTAQDASLGGISAETASSWGGSLTFHTKPANGSPNETVTERMRISQKGFVKAGPRITDSSHGVADLNSARHEFTSDDNGWTIIVTHTSGAASEHEGILINYNLDPNGTGNSFIQGNAGNTTRFRFASNGGLYNYSSNNSNLSDEREKKNIVSLDAKWDKVKSWDLKKFHYNEDADDDDLRYGVIAQQVEQHCPEVLTEWIKQPAEDAVLDEDGNVVTPAVAAVTRKGVKEQPMMWMAIKALQEAQTRIETLESQHADLLARVTALEATS